MRRNLRRTFFRPELYNSHLSTTVTSPQQSPLHNGHLFTTATSLQRSIYFVPEDSPHIDSYLNLSTTATSLQRQRPPPHVLTAKITSLQRPVFFPRLIKKLRMVTNWHVYDQWQQWYLDFTSVLLLQ